MDLYYSPLACSMATRIALYEANQSANYLEVDKAPGYDKATLSEIDIKGLAADAPDGKGTFTDLANAFGAAGNEKLGCCGHTIGSAWGGLLANFAAGVFLVVLRPFKVGDFISAGGTTGTVEEVGLFVTTIDTPDNLRTFVGNNKLFSDNIQNFSATAWRTNW